MANPQPDSATAQREAARRQRTRAYAERNELIAVLARLYDSHLMPATGPLAALNTADAAPEAKRAVICIHSPAGLLCWVITKDEVDEYFASIPRVNESHWDKSTRATRSERLSALTALPPPKDPLTKAKKAKKAQPEPPRRPGDFSRKRVK
jgi:hypothetical protein